MSNLENYRNLLECQSLDNKIAEHLHNIDEHKKRVDQIIHKRELSEKSLNENSDKLTETKKAFKKFESNLYKIEKDLHHANEKADLAKTTEQVKASESEVHTLQNEKDSVEEKSLEYLELIEILEKDVDDLQSFLEGSAKTLSDIQQESADNTNKENKEIVNYQKRIDSLLSECTNSLQSAYLLLNKKYRFKFPLTFIQDRSCKRCGFQINRVNQDVIERGEKVIHCENCGRVFVMTEAIN